MTDIPKRDDQHRDPLRAAVADVIQAAWEDQTLGTEWIEVAARDAVSLIETRLLSEDVVRAASFALSLRLVPQTTRMDRVQERAARNALEAAVVKLHAQPGSSVEAGQGSGARDDS